MTGCEFLKRSATSCAWLNIVGATTNGLAVVAAGTGRTVVRGFGEISPVGLGSGRTPLGSRGSGGGGEATPGGRVRVAVAVRPAIPPGSLAGGVGRLGCGATTTSSAPS